MPEVVVLFIFILFIVRITKRVLDISPFVLFDIQ
jgi:hypothetical protein